MRRLFAALLALGLVCVAGVAQAQNSPAAQRVLDRARAASGGAAGWNVLRGLHETGEEGGVKFERWLDPLRYGMRVETTGSDGGKLVQAYNGAAEWRILAGGVATGSDRGEYVAKVRSDAFFDAYGYFYPSRFDLRSSHLGARQHQGRSFEVLHVQPAGGEPRELWFDARSGMLARVIAPGAEGAATIVEISDYRRVGPVLVPFRLSIARGGRPPVERKLQTIDFRVADRALFSLPPAPPPPPPKVEPAPAAAPATPPAAEKDQKRGWRRWLQR